MSTISLDAITKSRRTERSDYDPNVSESSGAAFSTIANLDTCTIASFYGYSPVQSFSLSTGNPKLECSSDTTTSFDLRQSENKLVEEHAPLAKLAPLSIDLNSEEVLDWDIRVEFKPKHIGTFTAKIVKGGRLKPLPINEEDWE